MITVVNYGVGNLFSLLCSFDAVGQTVRVTSDPDELKNADRIVLPGVGAFGDAAMKLTGTGLGEALTAEAKKGKPILGVCLGMQLLFEESEEYGRHPGLGLLSGRVRAFADVLPPEYKIPQIGWNALRFVKDSRLLDGVREGDHVYFVHSFYADGCADSLIATASYGIEVPAVVGKENVYGCQFHPEKSGAVGLSILRAFCEL